jgi:hypothetical protein
MARLAAQAQETIFQATALQLRIELLTHILRQRLLLFFQRPDKAWAMLFDQLIQQRVFGAVPFVAWAYRILCCVAPSSLYRANISRPAIRSC